MTSLKPIVEMKDSGFQFIGMIPNDWDVRRGKTILSVINRPVNEDDGVVTCFRDGEVTLRVNRRVEGFTNSDKEIGYQGVEPGDLVVHGMDGFAGSIGISDSRGKMSPIIIVLESSENKKYLMYYLRAMAFREVFLALSTGIRVRSCDLRWNKLAVFPFVIPNKKEQRAIADYLDDHCSKLDEIITEAEKSIEEYKELKQAVIFETVTKGLDKNVEMKESGVEWLGEVPSAWKIVRLKYLLTHLIDCPHETPNYTPDGDYYVIRTADQDLGFLRPDENMYRLNEKEYINRIRRLALEKDDIVYGREGERWGIACIIPENKKYCLGQRMLHFRCNMEKIVPRFLMWALNSSGVRMQGVLDTMGSTSPHVNISTVRNFSIPIPDIQSQIAIVDYLDNRVGDMDALISEKQSLIEDLKAYKKSLIYEVVTGKRRVV